MTRSRPFLLHVFFSSAWYSRGLLRRVLRNAATGGPVHGSGTSQRSGISTQIVVAEPSVSPPPRVSLGALVPLLALSLVACTSRGVARAHDPGDSRSSGIEVTAANAPNSNDAADDDELAAAGITPVGIEVKRRDGGTFQGPSENVVREIRNRGEFMRYVCKKLPPEQRDAAIEAQRRRGYAVFCGAKIGPKTLMPK